MSLAATSVHEGDEEAHYVDETLSILQSELREWFGVEFTFWSRESGDIVLGGAHPWVQGPLGTWLTAHVREISAPQVVAEHNIFALVAIPVADDRGRPCIAAAPVVTRDPTLADEVADDAAWLACDERQAMNWLRQQTPTPVAMLRRLVQAVGGKIEAEARSRRLEYEVAKISDSLASTYEEISLLYDVTQNLRISNSETELGDRALNRLAECIPAENLALYLAPVAKESEITYRARTEPQLLMRGDPILDLDQLELMFHDLHLGPGSGPVVVNRNKTAAPRWRFPSVRELMVAPLSEGDRLFGWLAAFNHREEKEFGTIEASLLNSVSAILGVHGCNIDLYRQQNELLASVVRALTSAIDAKDPYTCGHSDRVARISVRLAQELGCSAETVHTLYMAGLVHDIGKIGIADRVLRKPGRLTEAEFEHIKLHPELGYKILCDIKQLSDVLPVVLHHHEQWDGRGYPHGLAGEEIPFLARICAVADAYDAMSSDRPYRKGMPEEKVVAIFREGAGKQWDAEVVNAFFRALDDIRDISRRERAGLSLDVERWATPSVSMPLHA